MNKIKRVTRRMIASILSVITCISIFIVSPGSSLIAHAEPTSASYDANTSKELAGSMMKNFAEGGMADLDIGDITSTEFRAWALLLSNYFIPFKTNVTHLQDEEPIVMKDSTGENINYRAWDMFKKTWMKNNTDNKDSSLLDSLITKYTNIVSGNSRILYCGGSVNKVFYGASADDSKMDNREYASLGVLVNMVILRTGGWYLYWTDDNKPTEERDKQHIVFANPTDSSKGEAMRALLMCIKTLDTDYEQYGMAEGDSGTYKNINSPLFISPFGDILVSYDTSVSYSDGYCVIPACMNPFAYDDLYKNLKSKDELVYGNVEGLKLYINNIFGLSNFLQASDINNSGALKSFGDKSLITSSGGLSGGLNESAIAEFYNQQFQYTQESNYYSFSSLIPVGRMVTAFSTLLDNGSKYNAPSLYAVLLPYSIDTYNNNVGKLKDEFNNAFYISKNFTTDRVPGVYFINTTHIDTESEEFKKLSDKDKWYVNLHNLLETTYRTGFHYDYYDVVEKKVKKGEGKGDGDYTPPNNIGINLRDAYSDTYIAIDSKGNTTRFFRNEDLNCFFNGLFKYISPIVINGASSDSRVLTDSNNTLLYKSELNTGNKATLVLNQSLWSLALQKQLCDNNNTFTDMKGRQILGKNSICIVGRSSMLDAEDMKGDIMDGDKVVSEVTSGYKLKSVKKLGVFYKSLITKLTAYMYKQAGDGLGISGIIRGNQLENIKDRLVNEVEPEKAKVFEDFKVNYTCYSDRKMLNKNDGSAPSWLNTKTTSHDDMYAWGGPVLYYQTDSKETDINKTIKSFSDKINEKETKFLSLYFGAIDTDKRLRDEVRKYAEDLKEDKWAFGKWDYSGETARLNEFNWDALGQVVNFQLDSDSVGSKIGIFKTGGSNYVGSTKTDSAISSNTNDFPIYTIDIMDTADNESSSVLKKYHNDLLRGDDKGLEYFLPESLYTLSMAAGIRNKNSYYMTTKYGKGEDQEYIAWYFSFDRNLFANIYWAYIEDIVGIKASDLRDAVKSGTPVIRKSESELKEQFKHLPELDDNGFKSESLFGSITSEDRAVDVAKVELEEKQESIIDWVYKILSIGDTINNIGNIVAEKATAAGQYVIGWLKGMIDSLFIGWNNYMLGVDVTAGVTGSVSNIGNSTKSKTYSTAMGYMTTPSFSNLPITSWIMANFQLIYVIIMIVVVVILIMMVLTRTRRLPQALLIFVCMAFIIVLPANMLNGAIGISNNFTESIYADKFQYWAISQHAEYLAGISTAENTVQADLYDNLTRQSEATKSGVTLKWLAPKKWGIDSQLKAATGGDLTGLKLFLYTVSDVLNSEDFTNYEPGQTYLYRPYSGIFVEAHDLYYKLSNNSKTTNLENSKLGQKIVNLWFTEQVSKYKVGTDSRSGSTISNAYNLKNSGSVNNSNLFSFISTRGDTIMRSAIGGTGLGNSNNGLMTYQAPYFDSYYKDSQVIKDIQCKFKNQERIYAMYSDSSLIASLFNFNTDRVLWKYSSSPCGLWLWNSTGNYSNELDGDKRADFSTGIQAYFDYSESPYYYFYNVLSDLLVSNDSGVDISCTDDYISAVLNDEMFKVTNQQSKAYGELKDYLDLEGLFSYVIPLLNQGNQDAQKYFDRYGSTIDRSSYEFSDNTITNNSSTNESSANNTTSSNENSNTSENSSSANSNENITYKRYNVGDIYTVGDYIKIPTSFSSHKDAKEGYIEYYYDDEKESDAKKVDSSKDNYFKIQISKLGNNDKKSKYGKLTVKETIKFKSDKPDEIVSKRITIQSADIDEYKDINGFDKYIEEGTKIKLELGKIDRSKVKAVYRYGTNNWNNLYIDNNNISENNIVFIDCDNIGKLEIKVNTYDSDGNIEDNQLVYNLEVLSKEEYSQKNSEEETNTVVNKDISKGEEEYNKHKQQLQAIWNMYSPWVAQMIAANNKSEKVRSGFGYVELLEPWNPADYRYFGREMAFSPADARVHGYQSYDLSNIEKKMHKVLEDTYYDMLDLVNYKDYTKVSDEWGNEVLISAAAMCATFNFNKEFSDNGFMSTDITLYPQSYELKNMNFDAYLRIILGNSMGMNPVTMKNSNYSGSLTIYEEFIHNTSVWSGLVLVAEDFLAVFVVPLLKIMLIVVIFVLALALAVSCIINKPDKMIKVFLSTFIAPLVGMTAIFMAHSLVISWFIGDGLGSNVIDTHSISVTTGDPTLTLLLMIVVDLVTSILMWKLLKFAAKSTAKYIQDIGTGIAALGKGTFSGVAKLITAAAGIGTMAVGAASLAGGAVKSAAGGVVGAGKAASHRAENSRQTKLDKERNKLLKSGGKDGTSDKTIGKTKGKTSGSSDAGAGIKSTNNNNSQQTNSSLAADVKAIRQKLEKGFNPEGMKQESSKPAEAKEEPKKVQAASPEASKVEKKPSEGAQKAQQSYKRKLTRKENQAAAMQAAMTGDNAGLKQAQANLDKLIAEQKALVSQYGATWNKGKKKFTSKSNNAEQNRQLNEMQRKINAARATVSTLKQKAEAAKSSAGGSGKQPRKVMKIKK